MKQKLLILLGALVTAVCGYAYDFTYDYNGKTLYFNKGTKSTCSLTYKDTNYNSYAGSITIPSKVVYEDVEYTVTSIGYSTFENCTTLTAIVMPNTVTSIGNSAFDRCENLKSITVSNALISIGERAFEYCKSLTSIKLPNTVTTIRGGAFWYCTGLTSINIPNAVSAIGRSTFYSCTNLKTLNIPSSVTSIGVDAFHGCSSLKSITIPEGVPTIEEGTFCGCKSLESISLPNSITTIGKDAFCQCESLTSIDIPENVTYIGYEGFRNCYKLESIVIPNSVLFMGNSVFYNCGALKSVILSSNITSIGDGGGFGVFESCRNLTSIKIPEGVTDIGASAFKNCYNLISVETPSSLNSIGESAFYGCKALLSIEISSLVTSIGGTAFYDCSSLKNMTVLVNDPSDITLGQRVFAGVPISTCELCVPRGSKNLYSVADQWSDFKNIILPKNSININDGEAYTVSADDNDIDVCYIRTFPSVDWQALFIPFDMSYEEWSPYAKVAELSGVHEYDRDDDGIVDRTTIEFTTVTSGKIKPNVPYVIKAYEPGETVFECKNKTLKSYKECSTIDTSSPRWLYTFTGTYKSRSDLGGCYGMSATGGKFIRIVDGQTLKPQRFFLTISKRSGGYWDAPARNQLPEEIYIEVDGELCGIVNIEADAISGEDGVYYDLFGRKVQQPTSGLYIHNGKKVFIK